MPASQQSLFLMRTFSRDFYEAIRRSLNKEYLRCFAAACPPSLSDESSLLEV